MGETITSIRGLEKGSDQVIFECSNGMKYIFYHEQDCCEQVIIEDICGVPSCLINSPITLAEEAESNQEETDWGTQTWTFYKLATTHGYVTIRWLGESNGYYSEHVSFAAILPPQK